MKDRPVKGRIPFYMRGNTIFPVGAIVVAFALSTSCGAATETKAVRIGDVSFRIGMSQESALQAARQSLVAVSISGTSLFFLYAKDRDGRATGSALGGIGFDGSKLTRMRRDLGALVSNDALSLGRRMAASIAESGYKTTPSALLAHSYRELQTASTNTIELRLPDRLLRIRVYESQAPGTVSTLEATEHFGYAPFDP